MNDASQPEFLWDSSRLQRTGVPEVAFAGGKSVDQLLQVFSTWQQAGAPGLATHLRSEQADALRAAFADIDLDPVARTAVLPARNSALALPAVTGNLLIVCAGTSDLPVAREALVTAGFLGAAPDLLADVGVAGIDRLLQRREHLERADVIVCIAGMEGALPSVVAGLVRAPVVAVPTSVGYGANLQGITPLLAMLASCAPGVTVVNIDNGFGAAAAAVRILKMRTELR
jgi:NCAIR mutase (PurE)-related protein